MLPCYNETKDILIPSFFGERNTVALNHFVTKKTASAANRPIDIFFRGTQHASHPEYSNGVRQHLPELFANSPAQNIRISFDLHTLYDTKAYWEELTASKFCLSPPGWVHWSPRTFQAISAHCVPIIIQNTTVRLPFQNVLDYPSFSIVTNDENIVVDPLSYILAVNLTLAQMQENLKVVWRHFTYGGPGMVVSATSQQQQLLGVCLESGGSPILNHVLSELALRFTNNII
jgi:hypothetical protein